MARRNNVFDKYTWIDYCVICGGTIKEHQGREPYYLSTGARCGNKHTTCNN